VGENDAVPVVGISPDHAPLAVQEVAKLTDHAITADEPNPIEAGVAEIAIDGGGSTISVALTARTPPGPTQVNT
jgi:hypothetical protein